MKVLSFSILLLLLFFSHPIGYLLTGLTIGVIVATEFVFASIAKEAKTKVLFRNLQKSYTLILFVFLPSILLLIKYLSRKGLNPSPNPDSFNYLQQRFFELSGLVALTGKENMWTTLISILFALILLYALYSKKKMRNFNRLDGFFIVFIIMILVYFFQPGGIAGAGVLSVRLQFIPYLILLIWFCTVSFSSSAKNLILVLSFILGSCLSFVRYPHYAKASDAVVEYISVNKFINDKSTVLPLSFSHNGITPEGDLVANRIWLFMHAADYIGTEKSLILLGNYEASTGYFPFIWKSDKNPFFKLSTNEGIEHQPPSVDILSYEVNTGIEIDYVITWCMDDSYVDHDYTNDLKTQLASNYELIFTSENNLAKLFRRSVD